MSREKVGIFQKKVVSGEEKNEFRSEEKAAMAIPILRVLDHILKTVTNPWRLRVTRCGTRGSNIIRFAPSPPLPIINLTIYKPINIIFNLTYIESADRKPENSTCHPMIKEPGNGAENWAL
jgi:hypothetical protein